MAVTHIQWVCNGIDTNIALILIAKTGLNAIDKMVSDDVPEDGFKLALLFFLYGFCAFASCNLVISIINSLFFAAQSVRTNLFYQCNIV